MNKKTVIAFLLIALLLILYPLYMQWMGLSKNPPPPEATSPDTAVIEQRESPELSVPVAQEAPTKLPAFAKTTQQEPEKEVKVETPLYAAIFSSKGGNLKSFVLKKYVDYSKEEIDLVKNGQEDYNLDVVFPDSALSLGNLSFFRAKESVQITGKGNQAELKFQCSAEKISITKSYTFYSDRYSIELNLQVDASPGLLGRKYYLAWNSGMPTTEKNLREDFSYFATYANLGGEILENKGPKEDSAQEFSRTGKTVWIATRNKYFVASLIAPDSSAAGFSTRGENIFILQNGQKVLAGKRRTARFAKELPSQPSFQHKFLIHIGPLDYWALSKYGLG